MGYLAARGGGRQSLDGTEQQGHLAAKRGEGPRRVILAHVFAVVVHILSLPAHPQAPAEPQIAGKLAGKLTALVDAPLKPQLATTAEQERFNLGIELKAFRHARTFLLSIFPPRLFARPVHAVPLARAAHPPFPEPCGPHTPRDAH